MAETHAVEDAQDVLMSRCMNQLGMQWKEFPGRPGGTSRRRTWADTEPA
ncbi:hypothetical protein ABZ851_31420 [Streptomyces sp. NPDC047049]